MGSPFAILFLKLTLSLPVERDGLALLRSGSLVVSNLSLPRSFSSAVPGNLASLTVGSWSRLCSPPELNDFYNYSQRLHLGHEVLLFICISNLGEKKFYLPHEGGGWGVLKALLRQMAFFCSCVHISKHLELALALSSGCTITWVKLEGGADSMAMFLEPASSTEVHERPGIVHVGKNGEDGGGTSYEDRNVFFWED